MFPEFGRRPQFKYRVGDVVCDTYTDKYAPPVVEVLKRWGDETVRMYRVRRVATKGNGYPVSEEWLV